MLIAVLNQKGGVGKTTRRRLDAFLNHPGGLIHKQIIRSKSHTFKSGAHANILLVHATGHMETRQVTKNGITVTYAIEGDNVIIIGPSIGKQDKKVSLSKPPVKNQGESWDDFTHCFSGCYSLSKGDPWAMAGCIALCSTILIEG